MTNAVPMVDIWRGPMVESQHAGHAVICDETGQIVEAWGNPAAAVFPRSSSKMMQALPLIESGAADAYGLSTQHLALACASHQGAAIHTDRVGKWLDHLSLTEADLRCGIQMPDDQDAMYGLIKTDASPCQIHNNCSGKHAGFLTLTRHLGAGPEYIDPAHPVQKACLAAFEEITQETSPGYGIDGCSAPNFIGTMHGIARALAMYASARDGVNARETAAMRLWQAMAKHPELVAGEGRACTELMRACKETVVLKTGADGFFAAILPTRKLGISLKIVDGATRASNCAIAAILVRLGVLDADHPTTRQFMNVPLHSRAGLDAGMICPADELAG